MPWSFAITNGKLAEVFFDKKNGKVKFWGHCFVKLSEYKTKAEKKAIKEDTSNLKLIYRNGKYHQIP